MVIKLGKLYLEFRLSHDHVSLLGLFLSYSEMDMNTLGMATLKITVYKKYGVITIRTYMWQ